MKIFLLWSRNSQRGRKLETQQIASSLQNTFSSLFSTPPEVRIQQNPNMALVFLELPVQGWKPPFFQEDVLGWAFSVDYPLNVRSSLTANGILYNENNVLPTLGRALEDNPMPLLREMSPPFSLIWSSKRTGETFVQNDGLGQTQLFEYEDDHLWALTNKITALKALGVSLELETGQWAVRCALGAFTLDQTGFKNTRFLAPSSQLRLNSEGVTRKTYDVLSGWVNPTGLSRDDCLELARLSLLNQIKEVMPLCERPVVDLTGGWDSRAVVSSLTVVGGEFSLDVKGLPGKFDVIIASELCKIAGIDIEIKEFAEFPPDDSDEARQCILRALLWQFGYMWTERQKSFLWEQRYLDGGVVNIMGHHSAIGRAKYERKIRAAELREDQYEEGLLQLLMSEASPLIRRVFHDKVRDAVRKSYRQADERGLSGLACLDFWFLNERNRRYNGASITSQTGLVFAPFLNPDYIRASYAYRALGGEFTLGRKSINPFHRHIIKMNMPEWEKVPYEKDLMKKAKKERQHVECDASLPRPASSLDWKKTNGKDYYNYGLYWKKVGRRIIDNALADGGFWTEVFDPDRAEQEWHTAPNEIAMLYLLPQVLQA